MVALLCCSKRPLADIHQNIVNSPDDDNRKSEIKEFLEQKRNCREEDVCKPHVMKTYEGHPYGRRLTPFGDCLLEVFSIKILLNGTIKPGSVVRIHGAIRIYCRSRFVDYLFKRKKIDAQVFEDVSPGQKLSLVLEGPDKLWAHCGDSGEFGLYAMLKCNDKYIFPVSNGRSDYFLGDDTNGDLDYSLGDTKGCRDLFEGDDKVGVAATGVDTIDTAMNSVIIRKFSPGPIIDEVVIMEAEMGVMKWAMLGMLKFKAPPGLKLYGKITARSCHFKSSIVLFHTTKKVVVEVKSNGLIPLSRSMVTVGCRSSLVIKVELRDASNTMIIHDETLHFNAGLDKSKARETMLNGVIKVEVEWACSH